MKKSRLNEIYDCDKRIRYFQNLISFYNSDIVTIDRNAKKLQKEIDNFDNGPFKKKIDDFNKKYNNSHYYVKYTRDSVIRHIILEPYFNKSYGLKLLRSGNLYLTDSSDIYGSISLDNIKRYFNRKNDKITRLEDKLPINNIKNLRKLLYSNDKVNKKMARDVLENL